jgi:hypothetical protein
MNARSHSEVGNWIMPIISYFAVVGAALMALLFVADANMESRPLSFTSNFNGLPKPWTPELNPPLPQEKPQAIQTAAVPPLVPQAEEPKPAPAAVAAAPEPVEAPAEQVAKVEPAPKKQKHARKQQVRREVPGARYAWRPDGNALGGGPWRF